MNAIAQSNQLITRLTENSRRNAATFRAAGINGPGRQTRCPRCGLFEGLLFWNLVACKSGCLDLRCPAGCGTLISFRVESVGEVQGAGSRSRSRSRSDASAGASVGAVGGGWFTLSLVLVAVAGFASSPALRGKTSDRLLSSNLPFSSGRHGPAVQVLTGEGDRSAEVAAYIDNVAETYGDGTRSAVQSVQYTPETNATRVVVYPDLPVWKAYFSTSLPQILATTTEVQ